jgi:uncharacterized phage infection (PIP) family protein YhgE
MPRLHGPPRNRDTKTYLAAALTKIAELERKNETLEEENKLSKERAETAEQSSTEANKNLRASKRDSNRKAKTIAKLTQELNQVDVMVNTLQAHHKINTLKMKAEYLSVLSTEASLRADLMKKLAQAHSNRQTVYYGPFFYSPGTQPNLQTATAPTTNDRVTSPAASSLTS